MKIFSFDTETNGLYGQAFAIGAIVTENGKEVARYTGRCPIEEKIVPWVKQNVLPKIRGIKENLASYKDLLNDFYRFYVNNKEAADIITHISYPVETKVMRDMIELNLKERAQNSPFPLIDVAGVLIAKGEDPKSAEDYIEKNGLYVPSEGLSTHNPFMTQLLLK